MSTTDINNLYMAPVNGGSFSYLYYVLTDIKIDLFLSHVRHFANYERWWSNNQISISQRQMSNDLKEVAAMKKVVFPIKLTSVYAFPVYSVAENCFYIGYISRKTWAEESPLIVPEISEEVFESITTCYIPFFLSTPDLYKRSILKALKMMGLHTPPVTEEANMHPNSPTPQEVVNLESAEEIMDVAPATHQDEADHPREAIGFPEFLDTVLFLYTRNQDIINIDACKALGALAFAAVPNARITEDYGVIKTCHEVYTGLINGTISSENAGIFERLIYQKPLTTEDEVIEWCNYLMSCFGCELLLVDQCRSPRFYELIKEHKKSFSFMDFHGRRIGVRLHIDKCVLQLMVETESNVIQYVYYVVSHRAMDIFSEMTMATHTRDGSLGSLCNLFQNVYNDRKMDDDYNRGPTRRR